MGQFERLFAQVFAVGGRPEDDEGVFKRLRRDMYLFSVAEGASSAPEPPRTASVPIRWEKEIAPQLEACRAAGLNITSFAYPNCQFTGETDELFRTNGFKHVRGGLLDVTPYDPKGEKRAGLRPVHTVDKAFIPAKECGVAVIGFDEL